jgi:predicted DNA-binding transcriptional regulator YafY
VKTDRNARLLQVEHLLYQHLGGLTIKEIADRCGVNPRTAYRDVQALESVLNLPIWEDGKKRGIVEGYFLPPVSFSLPEATVIFLAARLMLRYANRYDPNVTSAFLKLNSVVPAEMREEIEKALELLKKQKRDDRYQRIMRDLVEAWSRRRTAKISYQTLGEKEPTERNIDPYFIEPAAAGHSAYVIGHCHRTDSIRTFKIDRVRSVEITGESYIIPRSFDGNTYLAPAWGIVAGGKTRKVTLKFAPDVATIIEEVVWHPSQVVDRHTDGSVIMTLNVINTVELRSWILGWADKVEVLKPRELRNQIIKAAEAVRSLYKCK